MIPETLSLPVLANAASSVKGRRAFTLIELLVVIAIIAVLAGIAVPVIAKVKESGNSAKCTSNLRQICAALNLYAADNNNGYPKLTGYAAGAGASTDWDTSAIDPYLPERTKNGRQSTVFICPSAKYTTGATSDLSRTYMAAETLSAPIRVALTRSGNTREISTAC